MARRKKSQPNPEATAETVEEVPAAPAEPVASAEAEGAAPAEAASEASTDETPAVDVPDAEASDAEVTAELSADTTEATAVDLPMPDAEAAPEAPAEAETAAEGEAAAAAEADPNAAPDGERLVNVVESLLFASDRPLTVADVKRLSGQRDGKKIQAALEALTERRQPTGINVVGVAGGYALRTNPENAAWVGKLLQGKPVRLSRAMLETLAIVAYRQPVTRPEVDEIRGVDCGPVLGTLLERGLVRIIGKKEEVGRPLLYGTTPEFLRTFNLRELTELPTLREFHELSEQDRAHVDSEHPTTAAAPDAAAGAPDAAAGAPAPAAFTPHPGLPDEPEDQGLLDELDRAAQAASRAAGALERPEPETPNGPAST